MWEWWRLCKSSFALSFLLREREGTNINRVVEAWVEAWVEAAEVDVAAEEAAEVEVDVEAVVDE